MTCLGRKFLGQKMTVVILMIEEKRELFPSSLNCAFFWRYIKLSEKNQIIPKKICENSIGFYRKFIKFMINFNSKECYEIH